MTHPSTRRGFTVLELVIVLAIVVISFGLLLCAGPRVHETDTGGWRSNNLRKLALAAVNCHEADKRFPPAFDKFGSLNAPFSVHVHLLPYDEQGPLYRDIAALGAPIDAAVTVYQAPGDTTFTGPGVGIQNFAANLRVFSHKGFTTKYSLPMP